MIGRAYILSVLYKLKPRRKKKRKTHIKNIYQTHKDIHCIDVIKANTFIIHINRCKKLKRGTYRLWKSCLELKQRFVAWERCCRRWEADAGDPRTRLLAITLILPTLKSFFNKRCKVTIITNCLIFFKKLWECKCTCNEVMLRSSSDIYCSFLTLDLCDDCRFANIL